MSGPNPFAEQSLPDNLFRQESAAEPLNPYAAPTRLVEVVDNKKEILEPGEGLWRDGSLLVLHRAAEFPRRCIFTNAATDARHRQTLKWTLAVEWIEADLELDYGVTAALRVRLTQRRRLASWTAGLSFLLAIGCGWFAPRAGDFGAVLGCGLIGFGMLLVMSLVLLRLSGEFLTISRISPSYYWLEGAGPAFLRSLPAWRG